MSFDKILFIQCCIWDSSSQRIHLWGFVAFKLDFKLFLIQANASNLQKLGCYVDSLQLTSYEHLTLIFLRNSWMLIWLRLLFLRKIRCFQELDLNHNSQTLLQELNLPTKLQGSVPYQGQSKDKRVACFVLRSSN
jgi:hypothetical protein